MKAGLSICNIGFAIVAICIASGCSSGSRYSMEPSTTQPSYWMEQPDSAYAIGSDFDRLWKACEDVAKDYLFSLDRIDYRSGVLTTQPMVTSQAFEPWRWDASTEFDRDESTLSAVRRTITFEFVKQTEGGWQVVPKVLVERQVLAERRLTSPVLHRSAFTMTRNPAERATGSRELDAGVYIPTRYWYPVRRDAAFERKLATAVQKRVGTSGVSS